MPNRAHEMGSKGKAAFVKRFKRDLWALRFVALMISILLWITVLGGKKIEITKKVFLDYQLPKNLVIANQYPSEVAFRVAGPRAFIKEIEERPITIPIDLNAARVGDYDVVIRDDMVDVPLGLRVVSVSPNSINLKLDRASKKRVPIRAVFAGQLPEGMKVVSVTLRPSTVEITGALGRIQGIDSVPTQAISLSPNALRQESDAELSLVDLPGISVASEDRVVRVTAELEGKISRRQFRDIPVVLRLGSARNARSLDTSTLGIRLRPSKVSFVLEGPEAFMAELKATEIEVWAEIPQLKGGNYRARLDWRLPPELRVVRRSNDMVDISVPPMN